MSKGIHKPTDGHIPANDDLKRSLGIPDEELAICSRCGAEISLDHFDENEEPVWPWMKIVVDGVWQYVCSPTCATGLIVIETMKHAAYMGYDKSRAGVTESDFNDFMSIHEFEW